MLPDGTAAYVANATAEIAASMTPALPLAAIGMIGGGLIGGAPGAGVGASVGFGVGSKGMIFNDAYMEMYGMRDDDGKIIPEKDVTVMAHVISTAGAALESVGALAAGGGFLAKTGGGKVLVEGVSGLLDRAGKKKLLSSVGSMGASSKNIVKKLAHAVAKDPVLRGRFWHLGGAQAFSPVGSPPKRQLRSDSNSFKTSAASMPGMEGTLRGPFGMERPRPRGSLRNCPKRWPRERQG